MQRQITIVMHIFAEIAKMELGSPIQPEKRSPAFLSLRPPEIPSLVRSKDIKNEDYFSPKSVPRKGSH